MSFQKSSTVDGTLEFTDELHKAVYNEGCKKLEGPPYDLFVEGRYMFLTAITFRSTDIKWYDDGMGIMNYIAGETTANRGLVTKKIL